MCSRPEDGAGAAPGYRLHPLDCSPELPWRHELGSPGCVLPAPERRRVLYREAEDVPPPPEPDDRPDPWRGLGGSL